MTEYEFQKQKLNVIVRETTFCPGQISTVEAFIIENDLKNHDHICFDESICMNIDSVSKLFCDGMAKLKDSVSSLWIAMGGSFKPMSIDLLSNHGFICPKLQYPLRNPLEIVNHVTKSMQMKNEALADSFLWHSVDLGNTPNMTAGQLHVIPHHFLTLDDALKVRT